MVMRGQVIGDIVDRSVGRERTDMITEDAALCMPVMIGNALTVNFARCRVEEGHQIGNAVSFVIEVLKEWATRCGRQIRCEAIKRLDACAFIEAIQMHGRVDIQPDNMIHLWKEVRVGDLQVVLTAVRAHGMFQ